MESNEISFGLRLANEAQRAREMALALPAGKKRDALLEKARLADLGARINGWLAAPALLSAADAESELSGGLKTT
jgi:hypothetical protein